jgi:hypothetical protein
MFTTHRPRVRAPQGQPVEMALVSEDELFWPEVCVDKSLILLPVLLISLESRPSDLKKLSVELLIKKEERRRTIFMV